MKKIIIFIVTLLLLAVIFGLFFKLMKENIANNGINKNELDNAKIGYMPFVSNWPLFLAIEKNFFDQEGIKVELVKFSSGVDAINAIAKGDVDAMAVNPLSDLFNMELRTPGLVKIFAMQQSNINGNYTDTLLVKKGSNIQKIDDLRGKKIGVNLGTTAEAFIKIILSKSDLSIPQDVEIIKLAPNLQLQSLDTGQIDALVSYEPNTAIGIQSNIAQVLMEHPFEIIINPFPNVAFTISSKTVNSNPRISEKIVNVIKKSILYGRMNSEEANKSSMKYTGVTEDIFSSLHNPEQLLGEEIDKNKIQDVADLFYENNLISDKIDVNNLFYDTDKKNN